ncbi:MAG: mRNA cleavage and polyadenylation factor subunit [Trizodia sp. TS-e1964]|nr:MAG: mRNA cleavage and polyadenylation factor subunit [Trizodia sp. TS-e1964]
MQCFTELLPPSAVSHTISLPFTSPSTLNLIVAKTSLLQIFSLKTVSTEIESGAPNDPTADSDNTNLLDLRVDGEGLESSFLASGVSLQRSEKAPTTKLILQAEYQLSGTIASLSRVKTLTSKSGGETLLIAFRDAKVSLVEWDPERNGLSTISIHYYEQDDLQASPWATETSHCNTYLSVDPGSRCAALKFGMRNLAILPFHQADEDLVMDDYDPDPDSQSNNQAKASLRQTNGDSTSFSTPYTASFVLPLSALDPTLLCPIHLSFLHEYREPTFGVLSSTVAPSLPLLKERQDMLIYTVVTLDLEQRASTTILSVSGLPYDLYKVIPLPLPVGGTLLVGGNEIIHIDQAGKTSGVGVNIFAKITTGFSLADQSNLNIKLEGCLLEHTGSENGEMLVLLASGKLAILSFRMDGRSVSGLVLHLVSSEKGGDLVPAGPYCGTHLGKCQIFIGSESTDSLILGWTLKSDKSSRRRSSTRERSAPDILSEGEATDDDDNDLYSENGAQNAIRQKKASTASELASPEQLAAENYTFRIHDSLPNLAPMKEIALGRPLSPKKEGDALLSVTSDMELLTTCGRGKAGGIVILKREIEAQVVGQFDFSESRGIWSVYAQKPKPKGGHQGSIKGPGGLEAEYAAHDEFDQFMIVSKTTVGNVEESAVYALTPTGFEEMKGTEFEPAAGATLDVGTLWQRKRVLQILRGEVRSYDGDLGLQAIFPMTDEATGAEPKIVSASFGDPYLLVVRDDASILVLECDSNGDVDEVDRGDALLAKKWISGSLYSDKQNIFSGNAKSWHTANEVSDVLIFLLSAEGGLEIYRLPNLEAPIYVAETLSSLPPVLTAEHTVHRLAARETLTEILVADLGDAIIKSPYLILRSASDDLSIYEPFHYQGAPGSKSKSLRFLKISTPNIAKTPTVESTGAGLERRDNPMRAVKNIAGFSIVFLPGSSPSFLLKDAISKPRLLALRGKAVRAMSSFHTGGCERGFVYVDIDGIVRVSQFPQDFSLVGTGWVTRKQILGQDVHALSYHEPMQCYALCMSEKVDFELPKDDDYHQEWRREDNQFKPQTDQGSLTLVSPINWSIIHTHPLDQFEVALCIKTLSLETSEIMPERKTLIVVGTYINRGVDLAARGRIYIFEVIHCIPEPGRPETDRRLKLVSKEEVKGAVTSLSAIGSQGFLLVAQGQKCLVRGLKEDGSLLPVAFMDTLCHVSFARELAGTGLWIMGDALKGVWFSGYSEDPYKMTLFGKSPMPIAAVAGDFLPIGKHLLIVVADAECNLHIMQFDPEHPKTLSGTRLLHRTTFHLGGHLPSSITLLPRTPATAAEAPPPDPNAMDTSDGPAPLSYQLLITFKTGAVGLLTPLEEPVYRRLHALSSHLATTMEHVCGLNPRAHRAADGSDGLRGGIVDGDMLARWTDLGMWRRQDALGKVGLDDEWVLRGDLESVRGDGLSYL